ncbi:class I SAM-dependent methyltransferase [Corynebacterium bovis]|uniref:class I SAM-dependent methyltransferase n=1 Tax=Corynebacterium bovis TaxID=36808 RepID=UPI00244809EE|nr:class I SAM-dependent methyltransferase [Corynebacterium bovis]MDH2454905.1 class I SAM-dependent methyltransferase [Corynebacterium bovis]
MVEGYIDPERWPGVARAPEAPFLGARAEAVRNRLEELLASSGVALSSAGTPNFLVRDGLVLDRIVAGGWVGLAEGYMAGEWTADPLPDVLRVLLTQPFEKGLGRALSRRSRPSTGEVRAGELPGDLVDLYAGRTAATGSAVFHSGTRTSETVVVEGREGRYPVEVSYCDAPEDIDRRDLDPAQVNRITGMLDTAGVGPGSRVLELQSSGGQLAVLAARRGASVDVLTADEDHAARVRSLVREADVAGAVRVETIRGPVPSPRQWSGEYDAVVSVERMETLGDAGTVHVLGAVERMLAPGGTAVIQSLTTPSDLPRGLRAVAGESLDPVRAYMWPALSYPTVEHVREAAETSSLRVVAENHIGSHLAATVRLWRSVFLSRERQAAAAGFDVAYRRLWDFQLALHEALISAGAVDCVQFTLRRR